MNEILEEMKREAEELKLRTYLEKYGKLSEFEENKKLESDNKN